MWIYDSHTSQIKREEQQEQSAVVIPSFLLILKFICKSRSDQGSHPDRQGVGEGPHSYIFTLQGEMTNIRVNIGPIHCMYPHLQKYTYICTVHIRFIAMATIKRENNT